MSDSLDVSVQSPSQAPDQAQEQAQEQAQAEAPVQVPAASPLAALFDRWPFLSGGAILAAFFLAGAGLTGYELVWARMLFRVLGADAGATFLAQAVFLAGLSLGALTGGLFVDRLRRPLLVFAMLQATVAVVGAFSSIIGVEVWGQWFAANVARKQLTGGALFGSRLSCAVASLGPAAFLMGMALPMLMSQRGKAVGYVKSYGQLYAANALGAVLGSWLAGWLLLGWLGERGTAGLATLAFLTSAGLALLPPRPAMPADQKEDADAPRKKPRPVPRPAYAPLQRRLALLGLAVSGAVLLGLEALWTRLLALPLADNLASFGAMQALTLLGLALGAGLGVLLSSRVSFTARRPLALFALWQLLAGLAALLGLALYAAISRGTAGFLHGGGLGTAFWLAVPAAFCLGAQLPAALRCCLVYPDQPGAETGRLYAVNTVGAILGALAGAMLLLPQLGAGQGVQFLSLCALGTGGMLLGVTPPAERRGLLWLAPLTILLAGWAVAQAGDPWAEAMTLRVHAHMGPRANVLLLREGGGGSLAVAGVADPEGRPGSLEDLALFPQGQSPRRLGVDAMLRVHLPLYLMENPRKVCLLGLGAGAELRAATVNEKAPSTIVAADATPGAADVPPFFLHDWNAALSHPGVSILQADGRNHLLLNATRHDLIVVDLPSPLWSGVSAGMQTLDFLELVKARLNSNGMLAMRLPPAPASELPLVLATLAEAFPGLAVFRELEGDGVLCLGAKRPFAYLERDLAGVAHRLARTPDLAAMGKEWTAPEKYAGLRIAHDDALRARLGGISVLTDRMPRTEFPRWRGALSRRAAMMDGAALAVWLRAAP